MRQLPKKSISVLVFSMLALLGHSAFAQQPTMSDSAKRSIQREIRSFLRTLGSAEDEFLKTRGEYSKQIDSLGSGKDGLHLTLPSGVHATIPYADAHGFSVRAWSTRDTAVSCSMWAGTVPKKSLFSVGDSTGKTPGISICSSTQQPKSP
jgi:hypothetical protein